MKNKKFLYSLMAAAFALSLAGADVAGASCRGGVCTRDPNTGGGNCYSQSGKGTCPSYQTGQGRKRGCSRQQCQPGSNCPVAQPNPSPATQPAPAPSN